LFPSVFPDHLELHSLPLSNEVTEALQVPKEPLSSQCDEAVEKCAFWVPLKFAAILTAKYHRSQLAVM
jgi:hypothetical protein